MTGVENVTIINRSEQEVRVSSITAKYAPFEVILQQHKIAPKGGFLVFSVMFTPRMLEAIETILTIQTNVGEFEYMVYGEGIYNPYGAEATVERNLEANQTWHRTLTIRNPFSQLICLRSVSLDDDHTVSISLIGSKQTQENPIRSIPVNPGSPSESWSWNYGGFISSSTSSLQQQQRWCLQPHSSIDLLNVTHKINPKRKPGKYISHVVVDFVESQDQLRIPIELVIVAPNGIYNSGEQAIITFGGTIINSRSPRTAQIFVLNSFAHHLSLVSTVAESLSVPRSIAPDIELISNNLLLKPHSHSLLGTATFKGYWSGHYYGYFSVVAQSPPAIAPHSHNDQKQQQQQQPNNQTIKLSIPYSIEVWHGNLSPGTISIPPTDFGKTRNYTVMNKFIKVVTIHFVEIIDPRFTIAPTTFSQLPISLNSMQAWTGLQITYNESPDILYPEEHEASLLFYTNVSTLVWNISCFSGRLDFLMPVLTPSNSGVGGSSSGVVGGIVNGNASISNNNNNNINSTTTTTTTAPTKQEWNFAVPSLNFGSVFANDLKKQEFRLKNTNPTRVTLLTAANLNLNAVVLITAHMNGKQNSFQMTLSQNQNLSFPNVALDTSQYIDFSVEVRPRPNTYGSSFGTLVIGTSTEIITIKLSYESMQVRISAFFGFFCFRKK